MVSYEMKAIPLIFSFSSRNSFTNPNTTYNFLFVLGRGNEKETKFLGGILLVRYVYKVERISSPL